MEENGNIESSITEIVEESAHAVTHDRLKARDKALGGGQLDAILEGFDDPQNRAAFAKIAAVLWDPVQLKKIAMMLEAKENAPHQGRPQAPAKAEGGAPVEYRLGPAPEEGGASKDQKQEAGRFPHIPPLVRRRGDANGDGVLDDHEKRELEAQDHALELFAAEPSQTQGPGRAATPLIPPAAARAIAQQLAPKIAQKLMPPVPRPPTMPGGKTD